MEQLPYFFNLLNKNALISNAVTNGFLSEADLHGFDYIRKDKNRIALKDFVLDAEELFNEVFILMSDFGVLIDFMTEDTKYFENAILYFDSRSVARRKRGFVPGQKGQAVKTKQIRKFSIFSRMAHGAVMVSELSGCKIMMGFYPY